MDNAIGTRGYVTNIIPQTQSASFIGFPNSSDDNRAIDSGSVSAFGHKVDAIAIKAVFIASGADDTDPQAFQV